MSNLKIARKWLRLTCAKQIKLHHFECLEKSENMKTLGKIKKQIIMKRIQNYL